MELPASVQEIADVIGRESALHLVASLPSCYSGLPGKKYNRVLLYVPKRLKAGHRLIEILGQEVAERLVSVFGGESLSPANCSGNRGGRPKKNPQVLTEVEEIDNAQVIQPGFFHMSKSTSHGAANV